MRRDGAATRVRFIAVVWGGLILSALGAQQAPAATRCEDLARLHAPHVTITQAATVNGPATISTRLAAVRDSVPLCRVKGFITPTGDSHIEFEVWLPPAAAWNHELEAVGNGGMLGVLNDRAMVPGFNRGYATMTTDLGHVNHPPSAAEDGTWALGHPEKVIDYAYRGEHLATLAAKRIIEDYYRSAQTHSYYSGCSAGGIQGVTELLRYPKDYDGYIIGDATPDHLGQEMGALWDTLQASLAKPDAALTPADLALVHRAVLRQCVGKDGGAPSDAFLTNPPACDFQPEVLQCTPGQDPSSCLSPAKIGILENIYRGPVDPLTRTSIRAGVTPGSEMTWERFFAGKKNPAEPDRPWAAFLVYMVYSDKSYLPKEKYLSFSFGKDYEAIRRQKVAGEPLDAVWNTRNRNLDAFEASGGKVIEYHGWDDGNIPALSAVRFYDSIVADQARRHRLSPVKARQVTLRFYRLFMVPGMGHCGGGAGPSDFGQPGHRPVKSDAEHDALTALDRWVEHGIAPGQFIASSGDARTRKLNMTRPICPYPEEPRWNGRGDPHDAGSFTCAAPKSTPHTASQRDMTKPT
jgi:feruloyl esterase